MTIDDKLDNYYNIMKVYSRYPLYLGEQNGKITYSYEKIAEIGEKARLLIDENILAEEIEFKGIIKLHEMVASGLCSKVSYLDDNIEKYNTYKAAMLWFGYLYDYNAELDSTLQLKKANAYMGLYEYADGNNAIRDINNIDYAIDEYKKIALKDDSNFVAKVYLTEALLKKELAVKDREKDYTQVMQNYGLVEELYKTSKDKLSSAEITRYSALKQEMINAGLEVTEQMYGIMFYTGAVLSVIFFLLSVFLFFYNRIISVCRYFIKGKGNIPIKRKNMTVNVPDVVAAGVGGATEVLSSNNEPTERLVNDLDDTDVLNRAQDFATALLEADKTEILQKRK